MRTNPLPQDDKAGESGAEQQVSRLREYVCDTLTALEMTIFSLRKACEA
jgi:hypothetical protein